VFDFDLSKFDQILDLEEVEKVVYLTHASKDGKHVNRYRVEAVRDTKGNYSTVVYRQLDVIIQPSEITDGQQLKPQRERMWVHQAVPWTDRQSADDAIRQLLSLWKR